MNINSKLTLHTGNKMPIIGLGTWQIKDPAKTVADAINLGYRLIDTSGDYGSQPGVAQAIKKVAVPRDLLYLVTKVEETEDALESARKQVAELQIEQADLILLHRPPKNGPGIELWEGLIKAKAEGLTKDIGVSNYRPDQIDELIKATGEVPVVNQVEWTPFGHSQKMLDYCNRHKIIMHAYSPLTHGEKLNDTKLNEIAKHCGKTCAQTILRWDLQLGIVPIPKANSAEHLEQNLDILAFELSAEDMAAIDALNQHHWKFGYDAYKGMY